jgi:hypothetical protein
VAKSVWKAILVPALGFIDQLDGKLAACQRASKGNFMRAVFTLAAVAALGLSLAGCAVAEAGIDVVSAGADVVGTAADITGDVVTSPFDSDDSDNKKR